MTRSRIGIVLGVVLVAAACGGGGGVALEDYVADVDAICEEVGAEVDELGIASPADAVALGPDALALSEDGLDQVEDLEAPTGDDGEVAAGLVEALEASIETQAGVIEAAGDGADELALTLYPLERVDEVTAGVEAAEAAGSDDCLDTLEERLDGVEQLEELAATLGPIAEIRVGDCVLPDGSGGVTESSCDPTAGLGRVVGTLVSEGSTCDEGTLVVVEGVGFCIVDA